MILAAGVIFWCFRLESTKKSSLPTESDKEALAANEQKMTKIFPK